MLINTQRRLQTTSVGNENFPHDLSHMISCQVPDWSKTVAMQTSSYEPSHMTSCQVPDWSKTVAIQTSSYEPVNLVGPTLFSSPF